MFFCSNVSSCGLRAGLFTAGPWKTLLYLPCLALTFTALQVSKYSYTYRYYHLPLPSMYPPPCIHPPTPSLRFIPTLQYHLSLLWTHIMLCCSQFSALVSHRNLCSVHEAASPPAGGKRKAHFRVSTFLLDDWMWRRRNTFFFKTVVLNLVSQLCTLVRSGWCWGLQATGAYDNLVAWIILF